MANIAGWGRGTWGEGPWGEPTPIAPTGEQLSSVTGTVTVIAEANVSVSGIQLVSTDGEETVFPDANIQVLGRQRAISAGDVTVTGIANVSVTGVQLTSTQGSETVKADANVPVTGVSATASTLRPISFTGLGDAQISTAQFKFGGASLLLDGSGDSVESDLTYNFGGDPFTIEMWVRPANITQDAVFFDSRDSTSNNSIALRQSTDNLLVLRANTTLFNINGAFAADTWVHIAVTRGDPFGNTYSVFVNGVEQDSTLFGVTATAANLHIGSDFNGSNNWEGYIDELRVSDVDRYDGEDFTPATSEFTVDENTPVLLHFDGSNGSTTFTNSGFVTAVTVTGSANVTATGVQATTSQGEETVSGDANFAVTGQQLTSTQGDESVVIDVTPSVTGQQLTSATGDVTVTGTANISLTGEQATTTTGSVNVKLSIRFNVTGEQLSSAQGSVAVTGTANVYPEGVIININSGAVNVWGEVDTSQTSNFTPIADGNTPNWREVA